MNYGHKTDEDVPEWAAHLVEQVEANSEAIEEYRAAKEKQLEALREAIEPAVEQNTRNVKALARGSSISPSRRVLKNGDSGNFGDAFAAKMLEEGGL